MGALFKEYGSLSYNVKRDMEILHWDLEKYNRVETPSKVDWQRLRDAVEEFNWARKQEELRKYNIQTAIQLMELISADNKYIQAREKKHRLSDKAYIIYEEKSVQTPDLLSITPDTIFSYNRFESVISSLAFFMWQKMSEIQDNNVFPFHTHSDLKACSKQRSMKNPYRMSVVGVEEKIFAEINSMTSFVDALTIIGERFFPGWDDNFHRYYCRLFLYRVAAGQSAKGLAEFLLYAYSAIMLRLPRNDYGEELRTISRRPEWCLYHKGVMCDFLDIECHSSQNCPFYYEDSNKRK